MTATPKTAEERDSRIDPFQSLLVVFKSHMKQHEAARGSQEGHIRQQRAAAVHQSNATSAVFAPSLNVSSPRSALHSTISSAVGLAPAPPQSIATLVAVPPPVAQAAPQHRRGGFPLEPHPEKVDPCEYMWKFHRSQDNGLCEDAFTMRIQCPCGADCLWRHHALTDEEVADGSYIIHSYRALYSTRLPVQQRLVTKWDLGG